jgi:hypothetical protein
VSPGEWGRIPRGRAPQGRIGAAGRGSEPLSLLPRILPYVRRLQIESLPLPIWLSAHARAVQNTEQIPPGAVDFATGARAFVIL